jgi:hypothetical protein
MPRWCPVPSPELARGRRAPRRRAAQAATEGPMTPESQMPPAVPLLFLFFPGPSAATARRAPSPPFFFGFSARTGSLLAGKSIEAAAWDPGDGRPWKPPARDSERAPPPPHCFMRPDLRLIPSLQLRPPPYMQPLFGFQLSSTHRTEL